MDNHRGYGSLTVYLTDLIKEQTGKNWRVKRHIAPSENCYQYSVEINNRVIFTTDFGEEVSEDALFRFVRELTKISSVINPDQKEDTDEYEFIHMSLVGFLAQLTDKRWDVLLNFDLETDFRHYTASLNNYHATFALAAPISLMNVKKQAVAIVDRWKNDMGMPDGKSFKTIGMVEFALSGMLTKETGQIWEISSVYIGGKTCDYTVAFNGFQRTAMLKFPVDVDDLKSFIKETITIWAKHFLDRGPIIMAEPPPAECNHTFSYGGVRYHVYESAAGVNFVRYYEKYYCTKCLSASYKKLKEQAHLKENFVPAFSASPIPEGANL